MDALSYILTPVFFGIQTIFDSIISIFNPNGGRKPANASSGSGSGSSNFGGGFGGGGGSSW